MDGVCVCVCVCVCVYIYIYIHTHTYINVYTITAVKIGFQLNPWSLSCFVWVLWQFNPSGLFNVKSYIE